MSGPPIKRRDTVDRKLVEEIARLLVAARSALFITGAGISADSGLPTYRGIGGLYDKRMPDGEDLPIEALLSGEMLARRPEVVWKYIHDVELACRTAVPNRGHEILALLEERLERVVVFTQNVDGFHRAAGSKNVIAIHGDIHDLRCTRCDWRKTVPDYATLTFPPRCPRCNAVVRPDVVLFGEMLGEDNVREMKHQLREGFDIVFSVGTTSAFPYISYPVDLALQRGKPSVEINPGTTPVSDLVRYRLAMGAAAALDAIWAAYRDRHGV